MQYHYYPRGLQVGHSPFLHIIRLLEKRVQFQIYDQCAHDIFLARFQDGKGKAKSWPEGSAFEQGAKRSPIPQAQKLVITADAVRSTVYRGKVLRLQIDGRA